MLKIASLLNIVVGLIGVIYTLFIPNIDKLETGMMLIALGFIIAVYDKVDKLDKNQKNGKQ